MNILGFSIGRRIAVLVASFAAAAVLSACSGSKDTTTPTVTTTPAASASASAESNTPVEQLVAGSYAWVNPSTYHTLYYLSNDTLYGGGCTGACLITFPPLYANAYAAPSGNFTVITRSDGTGKQWAYEGHPLYMYSGDTGADQAYGNTLPTNKGIWYIARPVTTASTPSPTPTSSATPIP